MKKSVARSLITSSTLAALAGSAFAGGTASAANVNATTCPGGSTPVQGHPGVCEIAWLGAVETSWTVPAGVTSLTILEVGPGGGGGGASAYSPGGGGGGGQVVFVKKKVKPGETVRLTMGLPGIGGTAARYSGAADTPGYRFTNATPKPATTYVGGTGGTGGAGVVTIVNGSTVTSISVTGGKGGMGGFSLFTKPTSPKANFSTVKTLGKGGASGTGNPGGAGNTLFAGTKGHAVFGSTTRTCREYFSNVASGGGGSAGSGGAPTTPGTKPLYIISGVTTSGSGGKGTTENTGLFSGDDTIFGAGGAGGGAAASTLCIDLPATQEFFVGAQSAVTLTAGGSTYPASTPAYGGGGGGGTGYQGAGQGGATGYIEIRFSLGGTAKLDGGATVAATNGGAGYLVAHPDGGVFAHGTATFAGSLPGEGVKVSDITAIASTCDTGGYWLAGADGGVFAFGDATYYGSLPADHVTPNEPIVAIEPTANCDGYYLVGADGGIFAFGTTTFYGSVPESHVSISNIVGMSVVTGGYYLVGSDGGVFSFGSAATQFVGSLPGDHVTVNDIVGITVDLTGSGYYLVGSDGGVFAFGTAPYYGSLGGTKLTSPVVGLIGAPNPPCARPAHLHPSCAVPANAVTDGYRLVFANGTVSTAFN